MIGPKNRPTLAVPRDWAMNRPTRIAAAENRMVVGVKKRPTSGASFKSSTAESTETAGVIRPSP